jgi:PAS domain-containing protein
MATGSVKKGRRSAAKPQPHSLVASKQTVGPAALPLELGLEDRLSQPLTESMPPEMFTGSGLVQLADLLPVMTAYVDRTQVMRFMNKPYADWLGKPRREVIGKTMRELIGR